MDSTQMNPLLTEYNERLASARVPTARGATDLLQASIHEAGHWMAFVHFKVPVVDASVDRRFFIGSGRVIPTDSLGFVPDEKKVEVEYIATLAGAYAIDALFPFVDRKMNIDTSMEDVRFARKLLDEAYPVDTTARKVFIEKCAPQVRQLIHQNWSIIEALAYELMKHGRLFCGECGKVERKYGIGHHTFTTTKLKSARQKLAAFHSSPATLLMALLASRK